VETTKRPKRRPAMNIRTPTFSNVLIDIQSVIAVSPLGGGAIDG
jgi:hypothetical protein